MSTFSDMLHVLTGKYPFTDADIDDLRKFVSAECQKAPVRVHKLQQAEARLELAACEAIAVWHQGKFPDAWEPFTIRPGWPWAKCTILKSEATLRFSFGPETESDRGGLDIEGVKFNVMMAPPNLLTRAMQMFEKRDQRAEREPMLPPVGTPDGRAELKLAEPIKAKPAPPKTDSETKAKPRLPAKGRK